MSELICIHYSALRSWCLMCQWICYCFSDGTTERWVHRQNDRSDTLVFKWCPDLTTNMWLVRFKSLNMNLLTVDFGILTWSRHALPESTLYIYCSWQHWLCLHVRRYLLLKWLFWSVMSLGKTRVNRCKAPPILCMVNSLWQDWGSCAHVVQQKAQL